jgi:uncharacterized protein (TIRG00374 family)
MTRRHVLVLLKMLVAVGLLVWLVCAGTLDFRALDVYFDRPILLVGNIAMFVATYVIGALRWRLLLGIAGVPLPLGRAIQLMFVGAFFNVVAPGNIGGEFVKAIYVARDLPPAMRPRVYLIALIDRLLALAGLVAVAVTLNVAASAGIDASGKTGQATTAIVLLALVTLVLPAFALVLVRRYGDWLEGSSTATSRIAKLRRRLVGAARLISERPGALTAALLLSIAIHVISIMWFTEFTSEVLAQPVSLAQMAPVYPLGMLSILLPVSYAGFGVGHVAFEQLFAMVGLHGGANVINVYLIGQLAPCLLGVIPYLLLKRDAGAPTDADLVPEANP